MARGPAIFAILKRFASFGLYNTVILTMIKIKPIKQTKNYLCGPASLKMVLSFYKINKSEKDIAKLTKTTFKKGCSLNNILKLASQLNLSAYSVDNFSISGLKKLVNNNIPIIVDWFSSKGEGHYSVVVGFSKSNIFYIDPYFGKIITMSNRDFLFRWFDFIGPPSKNRLILKRAIVISK